MTNPGLAEQLAGKMPRHNPAPADKVEALASLPRPTPPRSRLIIDPPVEMSPSQPKPLEPEGLADPEALRGGGEKRRAAGKTKTTFGLTAEALAAKKAAQHWCLDEGIPLDSVVSTLLVLFSENAAIREAVRSQFDS